MTRGEGPSPTAAVETPTYWTLLTQRGAAGAFFGASLGRLGIRDASPGAAPGSLTTQRATGSFAIAVWYLVCSRSRTCRPRTRCGCLTGAVSRPLTLLAVPFAGSLLPWPLRWVPRRDASGSVTYLPTPKSRVEDMLLVAASVVVSGVVLLSAPP